MCGDEEEDELAPVPALRYVSSGDVRPLSHRSAPVPVHLRPPPLSTAAPPLHMHRRMEPVASPRKKSSKFLSNAIFGTPEATLHLSLTFEQYWGSKCQRFAIAALVRKKGIGLTKPSLCVFYLFTYLFTSCYVVFLFFSFLEC